VTNENTETVVGDHHVAGEASSDPHERKVRGNRKKFKKAIILRGVGEKTWVASKQHCLLDGEVLSRKRNGKG